jgi:hypothetical protein
LDCEAIVKSVVGETHEHVRHVPKDELGDAKCMPNIKNVATAQKSKFSKPLFMEARAFMHGAKKGDTLFIYAFLATIVKPQHEIPSQYKATRMCLKRRMLTPYQNINHMIV